MPLGNSRSLVSGMSFNNADSCIVHNKYNIFIVQIEPLKIPLSFPIPLHYTSCLIGFPTMGYHNPNKWASISLNQSTNQPGYFSWLKKISETCQPAHWHLTQHRPRKAANRNAASRDVGSWKGYLVPLQYGTKQSFTFYSNYWIVRLKKIWQTQVFPYLFWPGNKPTWRV